MTNRNYCTVAYILLQWKRQGSTQARAFMQNRRIFRLLRCFKGMILHFGKSNKDFTYFMNNYTTVKALHFATERQSARMSKIKNSGLDQYGGKPFEQQQFGTAGIEEVNKQII